MKIVDAIEITGLDRGEVLAALCNGTAPLGLGMLHGSALAKITKEDCSEALEGVTPVNGRIHFDYLFGRPVKIDFVEDGDRLYVDRVRIYDRDAGTGRCESVINSVREASA